MKSSIKLNGIYKPSENVVAREVQEEFVIIPITSGIGNLEDEIFSLNKFGKAIWDKLDGKRSLKDLAEMLALQFKGPTTEIEKDVLGLSEELLKRKIIVKL